MLEFASVLDIKGFEGAGQLHCMNVYESDQPEVAQLAPGSVKWARFVAGVAPDAPRLAARDPAALQPAHSLAGDAWPPPAVETRLLGDAPVEDDGSFFVNIIGNTPFYIQLLDRDKQPLYTMRTWIWVRSGSQRGCIGCHENKELAPVNRATRALRAMRPTFLIPQAAPSPAGGPPP
jgi:hypothetical protein